MGAGRAARARVPAARSQADHHPCLRTPHPHPRTRRTGAAAPPPPAAGPPRPAPLLKSRRQRRCGHLVGRRAARVASAGSPAATPRYHPPVTPRRVVGRGWRRGAPPAPRFHHRCHPPPLGRPLPIPVAAAAVAAVATPVAGTPPPAPRGCRHRRRRRRHWQAHVPKRGSEARAQPLIGGHKTADLLLQCHLVSGKARLAPVGHLPRAERRLAVLYGALPFALR